VRALVAFAVGILIYILLIFFVKHSFGNPYKLLFYTVEVKNKSFEKVVEELEDRLNKNGLKVIRTLPLSKALEERGVKDFTKYAIVLACDIPQKEELLVKVPSITNLIPCSIAVYEKGGVVRLTTLKELVFLAEEKNNLSSEDVKLIVDTYRTLRKTLHEVSK